MRSIIPFLFYAFQNTAPSQPAKDQEVPEQNVPVPDIDIDSKMHLEEDALDVLSSVFPSSSSTFSEPVVPDVGPPPSEIEAKPEIDEPTVND